MTASPLPAPSCAIHPSILTADFLRLGEVLDGISTADAVHVDVMDNHFVPNLTMGPAIVQAIQSHGKTPLDVHLMIEDADRQAPAYAELGAESVTFHLEAAGAPIRLARQLRSMGARAGVAVKPATDPAALLPFLGEFDMILVMTVEPGFGGQKFLDGTLGKIALLREAIDGSGTEVRLQVDGGITPETIVRARDAGADVFVAGSAVVDRPDPAAAIGELRRLGSISLNTEAG